MEYKGFSAEYRIVIMNIIDVVANFIKKYDLSDKTIIVGFSGGFDSMCLLSVLAELKKEPEFYEMKIIAAHFNHNWRGEESLKEQEVCRIYASSKGFEFYTKNAPNTIRKTENDARIARYEFFEEAYEEYDADAVFTAHNKDDNAETVLYHVIKGTGIVGLRGIAEKRQFFYRPLLTVLRSDIIQYCIDNNLTPNNDSSNLNTVYKRNYIRLNVMPALEKVNPNIKDSLNVLASNAINDNKIIEEYLKTVREKLYKGDVILTEEYKKLSEPVKLRIIYEYIQNIGLDYDSKKINDIRNFIEENINQRNGSTMSLASALWLYADDKIIETIPRKVEGTKIGIEETIIDKEGEYDIGGRVFTLKKYDEKNIFVFPNASANFAYVDLSKIDFPLVLRSRRDGDIIVPFGMSGSMKLKKYMNAKGVSRHKRDNIVLLCNTKEVLWVSGVGLSNRIGVKDKPTHVIQIQ